MNRTEKISTDAACAVTSWDGQTLRSASAMRDTAALFCLADAAGCAPRSRVCSALALECSPIAKWYWTPSEAGNRARRPKKATQLCSKNIVLAEWLPNQIKAINHITTITFFTISTYLHQPNLLPKILHRQSSQTLLVMPQTKKAYLALLYEEIFTKSAN
jgi:hypothetical protein